MTCVGKKEIKSLLRHIRISGIFLEFWVGVLSVSQNIGWDDCKSCLTPAVAGALPF